jgi:hypothetical protein
MKKPLFCAALLAALTLLPLAAQTGAGALTMLNTKEYSSLFISKNTGLLNLKYSRAISSNEDRERIASLNGESNLIDTPLEISLLSYAAGVIDVRPVEADAILPANNPRLSGLKLGSAVWKELTEIRFLDPSNTAAIGRYEGMLKFISDKNGVSRAEIEAYYRQGIGAFIAAEVDAQFNRVSFTINNPTTVSAFYEAVLMRNAKTGQYTLNYVGHSTNGEVTLTKELAAPSMDALLANMQKNTADFNQACIDQVRTQEALIPAVAGTDDMLKVITAALTAFYSSPTAVNYGIVGDIHMMLQLNTQVALQAKPKPANVSSYICVMSTYMRLLESLNSELANKIIRERISTLSVPNLTTAQINALKPRK